MARETRVEVYQLRGHWRTPEEHYARAGLSKRHLRRDRARVYALEDRGWPEDLAFFWIYFLRVQTLMRKLTQDDDSQRQEIFD